MIRENIAASWLEDVTYKWYLSVVEDLQSNKNSVVLYLLRAYTNGKTWIYPKEAQLIETETEQALMPNINVTYLRSVRIKCKIENDLNITDFDKATG